MPYWIHILNDRIREPVGRVRTMVTTGVHMVAGRESPPPPNVEIPDNRPVRR